mgnify:CR=1 FL=1|jgi:mannose-6-phosphate isomerase-like protein (cupin superfamily)
MIRKRAETIVERFDNKFGGEGYITVRSLVENEAEMNHKGRVFAHTTILPGHAIGFHIHENESETYYVYSGKGTFNDNGTLVPVAAGDTTFTPAGTGHGIQNTGEEPLELIALILFA